jgi:hypothetical protein
LARVADQVPPALRSNIVVVGSIATAWQFREISGTASVASLQKLAGIDGSDLIAINKSELTFPYSGFCDALRVMASIVANSHVGNP